MVEAKAEAEKRINRGGTEKKIKNKNAKIKTTKQNVKCLIGIYV